MIHQFCIPESQNFLDPGRIKKILVSFIKLRFEKYGPRLNIIEHKLLKDRLNFEIHPRALFNLGFIFFVVIPAIEVLLLIFFFGRKKAQLIPCTVVLQDRTKTSIDLP